jgi:hypothetical protein
MTVLQSFLSEVETSIAGKPEQATNFAWMARFFDLLETRSEPVLIDLYDQFVEIIGRPISRKQRLLDLHAAGVAALPAIIRTFAS